MGEGFRLDLATVMLMPGRHIYALSAFRATGVACGWLCVSARFGIGDARFVRPSAANRFERLALGLIVRFRHGT